MKASLAYLMSVVASAGDAASRLDAPHDAQAGKELQLGCQIPTTMTPTKKRSFLFSFPSFFCLISHHLSSGFVSFI